MNQAIQRVTDVAVGMEMPEVVKGPMTALHIMRWSAATENWHRIHYDQQFAVEVDGLPDVLVNGSWKQQVLCQFVKDWLGEAGWMWKIRFEFREMDVKGNTLVAKGKVIEVAEYEGFGYVLCDIFLTNQNGVVTTRGAAVGVLPIADGAVVPYPFVPPDRVPVSW